MNDVVEPVIESVVEPVIESASNLVVADPAIDSSPFYSSIPEGWRKDLSSSFADGDNIELSEKVGKYLDRYTDLPAAIKAGYEATQKIRSGQISTGLPENPSEQELTDYRSANGIPLEPSGYELSLDDGLILGDEDARIMDGVYQVALDNNVSTAAISGLVNAFLRGRENELDLMHTQDNLDQQAVNSRLREVWGNDHTTNVNMVRNYVNQLPESVRESFMAARMADGTAVFNSPEIMVWLADSARKLNPAGTVVPNSANPAQALTDEIADLEKEIGTDGWYKDLAKQQRYRQLLTAQQGMQQ